MQSSLLENWSGRVVLGRRLYLCWVSPRNIHKRKSEEHGVPPIFMVRLHTDLADFLDRDKFAPSLLNRVQAPGFFFLLQPVQRV